MLSQLKDALQHEKFYIGTTRFTDSTFKENAEWRKKHEWKGCIYGLNKRISKNVRKNALIYVLEMNNNKNKIEGIGLIRNYINYDYRACIYTSDPNYNRYIYNSSFRISRDDIEDKKTVEKIEELIFYGYGHYKRGQGITTISWSRLTDDQSRMLNKFFTGLCILPDRCV
tara:strand:+ start:933 stop:1442 length:510 start_codon:yes stop_codon:yes gene_type:complete